MLFPVNCDLVLVVKMARQCVMCRRLIRRKSEGPTLLHTICLDCLPAAAGYPIEDLGTMGADQADRLPFGFVRLDHRDRVVAYNKDESDRSRLDPNVVLGRDFFQDVAPCTNVKEFAGWVREQRTRRRSATTQFQFVFAFNYGRELVEIGLTYNAARDETYVLVRSAGRDVLPDRKQVG